MPRPQKYSDSDIVDAIQSLVAAEEDVNPMRVRMRLGGGNVARIKAIIAQRSGQLALAAGSIARMPDGLSGEFQRLSEEVSQQMLLLVNKYWTAAYKEAAAGARDENVRLRRRLETLEVDLAASTDLVAQIKAERGKKDQALDVCMRERDELTRQCGDMKAALRNAESDLRATQKVIEAFERNQRQDRDEIRQLQKRIEELVAELATLKANVSKTNFSRKALGRGRSS